MDVRKYRGRVISTGKWVYGWLFKYKHSPKTYIVLNEYSADELKRDVTLFSRGFAWYEVHPESVGQSLGREDKNGVEIYGGDTVKGKWQVDREKVITGFVKYYSNHGLFALVDEVDGFLLSIVWEGCEIIGNIHEDKP